MGTRWKNLQNILSSCKQTPAPVRLAAQFGCADTCTAHLIYVLVPFQHLGAHKNAMRTRNMCPDQNFSVNGCEHLKI